MTLFMKKVIHQSIELNWLKPTEIDNPKTLVLGSFNPYNPSRNSDLDYFYGRSVNHFWKSIARSTNKNENYFFDTQYGLQNKKDVMKERFCCVDVINKITFTAQREEILNEYLCKKVFAKFLDQTIWTTKTKYENNSIELKREYNTSILDFLQQTTSIKRVIHTMGTNRIRDRKNIKPKEARLNNSGFRSFVTKIIDLCIEKQIDFVFESLSPSNYAVQNGRTKEHDLDCWLKKNLYL